MAADGDTTERVDWTPWVYLNVEWGGRRGTARQVLLTIHFGEHHLDLAEGQVSFGLLKGELQLTPSAGKFPSNLLWPKNLAEATVDAEPKVHFEQRGTQRPTGGGQRVAGLDHRLGLPIPPDSGTFDCFLSHNSRDKPAVRRLAAELGVRGVSVWLDEDQLQPGLPWQEEIERGIRASRSVAVLVGDDGLGPWEEEEMRAALSLAVRTKRTVIPILLPDAPAEPDLPLFLGVRTWVDMRADVGDSGPAGIDRLIWGITGNRSDRTSSPASRGLIDGGRSVRNGLRGGKESAAPVRWRVSVQGSELRPLWKFSALERDPCLEGRLPKCEIGRLADADPTVKLMTAFRIASPKHIRPLSGDGVWPDDFSQAQQVAALAYARKLLVERMGLRVCEFEIGPPAG